MRRSLKFRPVVLAPLEDRVVMSHAAAAAAVPSAAALGAGVAQPGPAGQMASPQNTVVGNAGQFNGQSIAQTLQAGNPVYENVTIDYAANASYPKATTQAEGVLIVPDKAAHTTTTTKSIILRNNQGYEKVIDVATVAGDTTTHDITTYITHPTYTAPSGQVVPTTTLTQAETLTEQVLGGKTYLKGTITLPGGSVETLTGTVSSSGGKTTTSTDLVNAQGFDTKTTSVVTTHSELYQSTVTTTVQPDGATVTSKSNTWILRLNPPLPQRS